MNKELRVELEKFRKDIEKLSPEELNLLKKAVRFIDAGISIADIFLDEE